MPSRIALAGLSVPEMDGSLWSIKLCGILVVMKWSLARVALLVDVLVPLLSIGGCLFIYLLPYIAQGFYIDENALIAYSLYSSVQHQDALHTMKHASTPYTTPS